MAKSNGSKEPSDTYTIKSKAAPRVRKSTPMIKRAPIISKHLSHQLGTYTNRLWRTAATAPLYRKPAYQTIYTSHGVKVSREIVEGKFRRNGVVRGDIWGSWASGAAATNTFALEEKANRLRIEHDEEPKGAPLAPTISTSARILYEQALIGYVHKALENALQLTNSIGKVSRISAAAMQVGTNVLNADIARANATVPTNLVSLVAPKKPIKRSKPTIELEKKKA